MEEMAVQIKAFISKTWSDALSTTVLNYLQDCKSQWSVRLPYWDGHIVRNLRLGKNC